MARGPDLAAAAAAEPRPELSALPLSYVLPLRARDAAGAEELGRYVRALAGEVAEVIVVDGSDAEVFAAHAAAFGERAIHVPPDPDLRYRGGKVNGVETGLRRAGQERAVVADDDVRYDLRALEAMSEALAEVELVRPHNFFTPLPWHALLDTGRTLLNRAVGGDFPGTLGVRPTFFRAMGGYDGDVLFENLELMRTVAAAGGRVVTRFDILVARTPPTTAHFLGQRVRQAYDDFALPLRLGVFLAILPGAALALLRRRPGLIGAGVGGCIGLAEWGRRRGGGARVYPFAAALLSPVWVFERAVTAWLAVAARLTRGGVSWGDTVFARSATPPRELRRRFAAQPVESPERP